MIHPINWMGFLHAFADAVYEAHIGELKTLAARFGGGCAHEAPGVKATAVIA